MNKKVDVITNAEVIRAYMMRAISPSAAVKLQTKLGKNIVTNTGYKKYSANHKKNHDLLYPRGNSASVNY
jgi:hypothetical protein